MASQSQSQTPPLEERFKAALKFASDPGSPGTKPSTSEQLELYALFKQSTAGACKEAKPSRLRAVKYAKWASWSKLGKMPRQKAMERYLKRLESINPEFRKRHAVMLRSKL